MATRRDDLFVAFFYALEGRKMDDIDKKIITLLQENARTPLKHLAEEVFLSSPAVSARIEHLEKEDIITSYEAKINPAKLGYDIIAFINLEMIAEKKDKFYPFIEECPNVIECNCLTGDYSMLIKVAFPNTRELDLFVNKLQRFGKTITQIAFSTPIEPRGLNVSKL